MKKEITWSLIDIKSEYPRGYYYVGGGHRVELLAVCELIGQPPEKAAMLYEGSNGKRVVRHFDDWHSITPELIATKTDMENLRLDCARVKQRQDDLRKHFHDALKNLQAEEHKLQSVCPHVSVKYHPDPSGNSDSSEECLHCGKTDKRLWPPPE